MSCRPSAVAKSRARATGLLTAKPLLRYGVGFGTATWVPHGPEPYAAVARAAGQAPSSKPGCCQPAGALCADLHAAPVDTVVVPTVSLAMTLAGPAVVFVAATAIVLAPARTCAETSTVVARFHASTTRREELTRAPLIHTSAVSSPVTTSVALPVAARSKVRRKNRSAAGAVLAGSPSGYQIHSAPARLAPPGAPMNAACHSVAGSTYPVSKRADGLHGLG
nr:hypothetical protein GCM10020092_024170 [Actinoplanes digitatis]